MGSYLHNSCLPVLTGSQAFAWAIGARVTPKAPPCNPLRWRMKWCALAYVTQRHPRRPPPARRLQALQQTLTWFSMDDARKLFLPACIR